jgi:hypothetical protein
MRLLSFIIAALGLMMWGSCNIINPEEKTPTYVRVDSFRFLPQNYSLYGTSSHKITSVWAYFNNQLIGSFDLPATFPVIADKPGQLLLYPGIDFNGLKDLESTYPFYTFDSLTLNPQPGQVITPDAKTGYTTSAKMVWREDFELGNSFSKFNGDTGLVKTTDPANVFEGSGAGYILLKNANGISENISSNNPAFQATAGQNIFLELNYKCSIPFQVGLEADYTNGNISTEYIGGVNAKDTWNKIYINLNDFVNAHSGANYHVIIRASLDNGVSSGWVLVDNLKVITYQ